MCDKCFDDNKIRTKTTFTVEYSDCIIAIHNVPCLECRVCGKQTFSYDVFAELFAELENIVNEAKRV